MTERFLKIERAILALCAAVLFWAAVETGAAFLGVHF